jgi:peptidylprolyl isomerase
VRRSILLTMALLASPIAVAATAASAGPAAASSTRAALYPTVSGSYGQTPKITIPKGTAPSSLEIKVLHQGTGPVTKTGNVLAVNYLGQIWGGKVFDSSFSRRQLFGFGVGVGQVISGWDKALVGVHVGSRLLLVVPPADGYGATGQSAAGITKNSVLIFVVDVVDAYGGSAEADAHAVQLKQSVGGIKVTGKLGAVPKITVAKGTPKPTKVTATVLARGSGSPLKAGPVVIQYMADNWSSAVQQSTWASGEPYAITLTSGTTFPNTLLGVPVGSRVLVDLPSSSSGGPFAMVIDVVAQPKYPS